MTEVKLTEACTDFSVSEICWFARACEGSHSIVTVGIYVTIMWTVGTFVSICKANSKKRNIGDLLTKIFHDDQNGLAEFLWLSPKDGMQKILRCDYSC